MWSNDYTYMKFILGKKMGMTQIFAANGEIVPVTRVQAGPCLITQIKTAEKNNAQAVEIGFDEIKEFRLNKAKAGHLKDLSPLRHLRSFVTDNIVGLNRGDVIGAEVFAIGDKVAVQGEAKGRGFAGVVKRHGFHGAPATHGHKHDLRAPGSIGAGGVQRVFKGMRMAGHMGAAPVTVQNLEIIEVHPESNELYIKGALPGARNGLLKIYGPGELKTRQENKAPETIEAPVEAKVEATKVETVQEEKKEESKE